MCVWAETTLLKNVSNMTLPVKDHRAAGTFTEKRAVCFEGAFKCSQNFLYVFYFGFALSEVWGSKSFTLHILCHTCSGLHGLELFSFFVQEDPNQTKPEACVSKISCEELFYCCRFVTTAPCVFTVNVTLLS